MATCSYVTAAEELVDVLLLEQIQGNPGEAPMDLVCPQSPCSGLTV